MKKNNTSNLILTALVLVALAVGVVLVKQSQELRKGASFTTASLNLWPSDRIDVAVGGMIPVRIRYQAVAGKVVDGVQSTVCHDGQLIYDHVSVGTDLGFDANPVIAERDINGKKCVTVVITATQPTSNLRNAAEVGIVYFKANTVGEGNITVDTSKSMITGDNPNSLDKEVAIADVAGTSYKITETVVPTEPVGLGPVLNFKVAFNGVLKANQCANNMKVRLTIKAGSETKVFENVPVVRTEVVNSKGYSIYTGSKVLSTLTAHSGIAAFVKGSKHLQMKYGVNNQNTTYGKAGGELTLTDAVSTSVVYNFSEYPNLPGDVNQDGKIDGVDFSLEKSKVATHATVTEAAAEAQYDLDGSCQLNTLDVTLLVKSLDEKQEEIY